jgi:hypothetical protein
MIKMKFAVNMHMKMCNGTTSQYKENSRKEFENLAYTFPDDRNNFSCRKLSPIKLAEHQSYAK